MAESKEFDAYYSKTGDERHGAVVWELVDGGEVRVSLVVEVGKTPQHGFTDLVYVGRVKRFIRSEVEDIVHDKRARY
jgi:hypothetical protein